MKLPPGIYEQLVNIEIEEFLRSLSQREIREARESVGASEAPLILSRYLGPLLRRAIAEMAENDRIVKGRKLLNRLIDEMAVFLEDPTWRDFRISEPPDLLLEIPSCKAGEEGVGRRGDPSLRPLTGLSEHTLLTGSPSDPTLVRELEAEILSASRIDWMVSFLRWSGLRFLLPALGLASARGIPIRIVTTTYMKATEIRCLDELAALPGVRLRLSLDESETRLHAKAYLFSRESGFSTAYIGSSNTSKTAFTTGLEWNVKVSGSGSPDLWEKIAASFESVFFREDLVEYSGSTRDLVLSRLEEPRAALSLSMPGLSITPYPFQEKILEALTVERELHGSVKNLVVAATGTGKTVIAALDYKRLKKPPAPLRLLFVAHRREILEQSLETYRRVLGDPNFGTLLLPEASERFADHLFVSVQLLDSRGILERISPDFFDVVVVDEVHHGEAPTYRKIFSRLAPRFLLGLTATPERSDGLDILAHFGGRIAAEIRLPEAISQGLLVPFHYFGITDSLDYRQVRWERGGYNPSDLDRLITGDDLRAGLILKAVDKYLAHARKARGLGFCVSVNHAMKMAEVFTRAGLPSEALHAGTPSERRELIRARLAKGEISFIFSVDLFNEGVDIPEVDTVLFLRPTESLTVFLQQLGRGLRRHPDKEVLTVLDFIGQCRAEYDFESRFRALVGRSRRPLAREIESDFPFLPPGCAIRLEEVARRIVLGNVTKALSHRPAKILERLSLWERESRTPLSLGGFLETTGLTLGDLYRKVGPGDFSGFSRLKVRAGVAGEFSSPDEGSLTQGIARLSHVGGGRYGAFLERIVGGVDIPVDSRLTEEERRFFLMFHYGLWGQERSPKSLGMARVTDTAARLRGVPPLAQELLELLRYNRERQRLRIDPLTVPGGAPLDLHGRYQQVEILAAFSQADFDDCRKLREGVLYLSDLCTDLLFVTLKKSEKDYSPSTMYKDYPVSERVFHWQSQSRTTPESPTGRRYIHHQREGGTILLFVREEEKERERPLNLSSPYLFLGPVRYMSHEGSRPMSILWELDFPMPPDLYLAGRAVAG